MVKINCGYCEKGNEQVIDVITIEMGRMGSLLGDALVLWLIPCGVKCNEQVIDVITSSRCWGTNTVSYPFHIFTLLVLWGTNTVQILFVTLLGDALVLWLIPCGVKREDIRLVSIKD